MASKDFNKAFAAARKELGAGKTFTYNGKSYSTNLAGEDKPKGFSVDMAKKAIDKAVGPKPVKRPAMATSKDAPMQTSPRPPKKPTETMPVAKSIKVAKAGDITASKLATTKAAGRGGFASGPAAGMPAKKTETAAEREKRIAANTPLGRMMKSFSGPYTAAPAKPKPKTSITPVKSRKDAIEAAMKKRNK
jgi:hypothetical protein